jgi:KDO2-lipid IV(A) lauroyltransferase
MTVLFRLIRAIAGLISILPLPVCQVLGKMAGTAASLVPMSRSSVSLENIDKSRALAIKGQASKKLNQKVFAHFGQMFFEIPHILRLSPSNLDKYMLFRGEEHLQAALLKGKGLFILTAHFGNWEWMNAGMTMRFGNGAVVVRPIDFPPLDWFMNEVRSRFGTEIIPNRRAMRKIMAALKRNKMVGILLDQNVDWYEGVFVDFLGRRACMNKGLALLAMKTGAPVIPAFPVKQKDGRYVIIIEKEVQLVDTGDRTRDIEDNTTLFARIIERYILKHPEQWFWFHKRWKTRPYCLLPPSFHRLQ